MSVNPYSLFGLSTKSTIKELRKSYYELSLCCHPDKGGSSIEMDVVHKAYLYIKEQLDNCKEEKSYEMLEDEFEDFCKKQTQEPPCFREIYDNYNDFSIEFNRHFIERNRETSNNRDDLPNPFQFGYSDFMEESNNEEVEYPQNDHNEPITNDFEMRVITYQEPHLLPDSYGEHLQLNEEKITDFSHKTNNLTLTDYVRAFSVKNVDEDSNVDNFIKTYEELINEREKLDNQLATEETLSTPLIDNFNKIRNNAAIKIQKKYRSFKRAIKTKSHCRKQ
jgi:hypothetical protein